MKKMLLCCAALVLATAAPLYAQAPDRIAFSGAARDLPGPPGDVRFPRWIPQPG